MSVNEVYKLLQFLVNKYQGGYLTPEEFKRVFNSAQREYFNCLTSDTKYKNFPIPKTTMKEMQGVSESLAPFMVEEVVYGNDGVFDKPSDMYRVEAIRTTFTRLTTPSLVATSVSGSRIDVSWSLVPNATKYYLYSNTTNNFSTATLIYSGNSNIYVNNGLTTGQTYYYFLIATANNYNDSDKATANAQTQSSFLKINGTDRLLINSTDKLII